MGLKAAVWVAALGLGVGMACAQATGAGSEGADKAGKGVPQGAAQKFPYPGEAPAAGETPDAPTVSGVPGARPDAPAAPSAAGGDSAAKKFPYPREPDADAKKNDVPDAPNGAAEPKAPADDWSSSSSSGASGSDAGGDDAAGSPLKDAGSTGDDTKTAGPSKRRKLAKVDAQTPAARASEDLDVAKFYLDTGNFKASYARAKDAVSLQPNDPFSHFALAEAARKLGKGDEAKTEYAEVLKLDPAPKEQKASRRALEELSSAKR